MGQISNLSNGRQIASVYKIIENTKVLSNNFIKAPNVPLKFVGYIRCTLSETMKLFFQCNVICTGCAKFIVTARYLEKNRKMQFLQH